MEGDLHRLRQRNLGDLLNETFSIYLNHFWILVGLVAVVQVPMSILTLIPSREEVVFSLLVVASLFSSVAVYSATTYAVGQHYIVGRIRIKDCYNRVYWRLVTLIVITLMLAVLVVFGIGLVFLIFPTVLLIAFLVYWSLAIPSVIVEGYKPIPALKRSFYLVQGNWWRVFGISIVIFLVVLGLALALIAPFALVSRFVAPEEANVLSQTFLFIGSVLVAVAVPPVLGIAGTLLYYDLRVRKEDYNLSALSEEMGIATA